jgi:hypothetical protein
MTEPPENGSSSSCDVAICDNHMNNGDINHQEGSFETLNLKNEPQDPAADEQKETSETRATSARFYTDIYGRMPGKDPKYPIPCPSE